MRLSDLITKEQFLNYCSYPIKALSSKNFYFDVLFRMKGFGLLYLLALCVILTIPASVKINHVLEIFLGIELPRIVAMIPPSYVAQDGSFRPLSEDNSYKEIFTTDGTLAVVYNVKDQPLSENAQKAIVELNSKTISVKAPTQKTVVKYTDLVTTGTNFDPLETSNVVDAIFGLAVPFVFVFLLCWFFCILVFNSLVMAVLSKFLFVFVGKIKTSFGNTLRLCSFANTIVGILLLVELILNVKLPFNLIMLLPMVYMILFVRNFRSELEKNGVEEFVRKYTPQGTTIKNYDSESTQTSRRDISDFTDGLDSTTNKGRTTVEDSIENQSDTEQCLGEKNSETSEGSTNAKTNSKSSDNSGDGPGYFAP